MGTAGGYRLALASRALLVRFAVLNMHFVGLITHHIIALAMQLIKSRPGG